MTLREVASALEAYEAGLVEWRDVARLVNRLGRDLARVLLDGDPLELVRQSEWATEVQSHAHRVADRRNREVVLLDAYDQQLVHAVDILQRESRSRAAESEVAHAAAEIRDHLKATGIPMHVGAISATLTIDDRLVAEAVLRLIDAGKAQYAKPADGSAIPRVTVAD